MFVLLAKIVGCCGISCKKLPHVVPKLQQCLPAPLLWQCPRKGWRFANDQHLSQELYHTTGQISRWFAKFPHPICTTVLHMEHPTPPPTLKNPAKTPPLPGKIQLKPNKAHPLPSKTQPEGMKNAPRNLLVRLMCCLVEQTPCLVIC